MNLANGCCPDCGCIVQRTIKLDGAGRSYWSCPECGTVHFDSSWYKHITEKEARIMVPNGGASGCYVCDTGYEIIGVDTRSGRAEYEEFPDLLECLSWFLIEPRYTKDDVRYALEHGRTLCDLFSFESGQECEMYKHHKLVPGDKVIYIPDIDLNSVKIDVPVTDPEEIDHVIGMLYTGDDFIDECDGEEAKAAYLFHYVDWQHPSSALPEIEEGDEFFG